VTALRGGMLLLERNLVVNRGRLLLFASGCLEPLLYLLSIGVGVGALVGDVVGPGGELVPYRDFVAPGMLAAATMTGAVYDTTYSFFTKLKYQGLYDSVLATPLRPIDIVIGEVAWALCRGAFYASAFLVAMLAFGLLHSWTAVFIVPAAVLISFAFAGAGLAAGSYMRSAADFDLPDATIVPMFLFSATFFPLTRYPDWLELLVRVTPLYQGVALVRALAFGVVDWSTLGHALYLAVMGGIGMRIASRRLSAVLAD
jgi:lipooligosaccharide transport system permease protein